MSGTWTMQRWLQPLPPCWRRLPRYCARSGLGAGGVAPNKRQCRRARTSAGSSERLRACLKKVRAVKEAMIHRVISNFLRDDSGCGRTLPGERVAKLGIGFRVLNDREWERLARRCFRWRSLAGRPRRTEMRSAMNSVFYLLRTGCPWRYLPRRVFPPHSTVYNIFRAFQREGVWEGNCARPCGTAEARGEPQRWRHQNTRKSPLPSGANFRRWRRVSD